MMPDLPNVGMERDLEQFKEYFENPEFRTDGLNYIQLWLFEVLVYMNYGSKDYTNLIMLMP